MDMPERYVSNKDYHLINEKNIKISKGFHAWGLNGVRIEAMDLIEENVLIRGDLNRVNIGVGTIIDAGTVLHNCLNSPIAILILSSALLINLSGDVIKV